MEEAVGCLESPHGLSQCLKVLDENLDWGAQHHQSGAYLSSEELAEVVQMRLLRALILAFLGADDLAMEDFRVVQDHPLSIKPPTQRSACPLSFVCSAAEWHRARRQAMLHRYPQIQALYLRDNGHILRLTAMVLALSVIHIISAVLVAYAKSFTVLFLVSATVGAYCAYGMQALTHELGHMDRRSRIGTLAGLLATSFLNFPFAMYYWHYHARHHAHTGGLRDRDGDILFLAWHSPPERFRERALTRWMWLGIFAFSIFPMFCRAKKELDVAHQFSLQYEGLITCMHLGILVLLGPWALFHLLLSSAFSLGAFGHPYGHFWLTQHAFALKRKNVPKELEALAATYCVRLCQPTLSYSGSWEAWHWLNFGELRHVEHHDWPLIPFWRMPGGISVANEFYCHLNGTASFSEALFGWLFTPGDQAWMKSHGDFAGRSLHLRDLWRRHGDFARLGACDSDDDVDLEGEEAYEDDDE